MSTKIMVGKTEVEIDQYADCVLVVKIPDREFRINVNKGYTHLVGKPTIISLDGECQSLHTGSLVKHYEVYEKVKEIQSLIGGGKRK